jgi:hypothetical protein
MATSGVPVRFRATVNPSTVAGGHEPTVQRLDSVLYVSEANTEFNNVGNSPEPELVAMDAPTESEMNTKSLLVAKSRLTKRTVTDSDGRS